MSILDHLTGFLAPHDCVGCGYEGSLLCSGCAGTLSQADVPLPVSGSLFKIRAAAVYEGLAKDLTWKLKSGGAQAAARIMASQMAGLIQKSHQPLIVPIPTATSRVRQRGYDQAKLLARALARQTGLTYMSCLARYGQTHQVGASRQERLKQLGGAFSVTKKSAIDGLHIVLVDDVTTTGATLETVANVLQQAGAAHIEAVTFAYKPKDF